MPQPSTSTTTKTPNTNAKKPAASSVVSSVDGEIIADFILAELQMSGRETHLSFSFSDPHSIPYSRMMTAVLTKQKQKRNMKLRNRGHLSEHGRSHAPEFASANQYVTLIPVALLFMTIPYQTANIIIIWCKAASSLITMLIDAPSIFHASVCMCIFAHPPTRRQRRKYFANFCLR